MKKCENAPCLSRFAQKPSEMLLIPDSSFLISNSWFLTFPKNVENGPKIPEGRKNRERFPSVGTLGTNPAQPAHGLRNAPCLREMVIFGAAGVRLGWVGTGYRILAQDAPRPPQNRSQTLVE